MEHLQDHLNRAIDVAASTGDDWCITLESKNDSTKWIQFTWDHINLHYPVKIHPSDFLSEIGWPNEFLELSTWEADSFVTFSHGADESMPAVVEFVTQYIRFVFDNNPDLEYWNVTEEAL